MIWVIIGSSDNGLEPKLSQVITWVNNDLLSIGPLGWNFNLWRFTVKKMHLVSFAKEHPCIQASKPSKFWENILFIYINWSLVYLPVHKICRWVFAHIISDSLYCTICIQQIDWDPSVSGNYIKIHNIYCIDWSFIIINVYLLYLFVDTRSGCL